MILSDLHMPLKDGFDFIEEVKADLELRKIPFVFTSSTMGATESVSTVFREGLLSSLFGPLNQGP